MLLLFIIKKVEVMIQCIHSVQMSSHSMCRDGNYLLF